MTTPTLIGTLTIEDLASIRRLSRPDAEVFLRSHTLNEEERKSIDALIGKDIKPHKPSAQLNDPLRSLWLTSAWLAGASWRQLAKFHGVSPQTIMSVADRMLTSRERQVLRIQSEMSLESLDAYRRSFNEHAEYLADLSPREAAQWLLDNTELDNAI